MNRLAGIIHNLLVFYARFKSCWMCSDSVDLISNSFSSSPELSCQSSFMININFSGECYAFVSGLLPPESALLKICCQAQRLLAVFVLATSEKWISVKYLNGSDSSYKTCTSNILSDISINVCVGSWITF